MPLFDEGNVVGVIDLDSDVPDNCSPEDREFLQTFAGVAAVALRNARLFAERVKREGERKTTGGGKKT